MVSLSQQLLDQVDEFLAATDLYSSRSDFISQAMIEHLLSCIVKQKTFDSKLEELRSKQPYVIPGYILHASSIKKVYEDRMLTGSWKPAHLVRSLAYQYVTTERVIKDVIDGKIVAPGDLVESPAS